MRIIYFLIFIILISCNESVKTQRKKGFDFCYYNNNNKKVSLSDLKGKLVYIDIWATWCEPCYIQIPKLKILEEEYKNKDIYFVSISVEDASREKVWKETIKKLKMTNIHLLGTKDADVNEFLDYHNVYDMPCFILLDKNGGIITNSAPKPTDSIKIRKLINKYL